MAVNPNSNIDLWVRPQNASGQQIGTYVDPFVTMAAATGKATPGTVIGLEGVLLEEHSTPLGTNNVTIVGIGETPRQATTSGVANGGGATWLTPSGGTGSLLTVQGQAWTIKNIYFNNSVTTNTTACLKVLTTGDPPTLADGAHILIQNCFFTGANFGVYASGGTNFVNIDNSFFLNFSDTGDTAIKTVAGAGVGTLLNWRITNNYFSNNVHNIVVPGSRCFVIGNTLVYLGNSVTSTTLLSMTGGTGNVIYNNKFGLASDTAGIATIVAMGTSPTAGPNFYSDATEYAQPSS